MSSFTQHVPAGSTINGIGAVTTGLRLRVHSDQPIGAPALCGKFTLLSDDAIHSVAMETHLGSAVTHNEYMGVKNALPKSGTSGNFEDMHAALVSAVGPDPHRMAVVNETLLSRKQWEVNLVGGHIEGPGGPGGKVLFVLDTDVGYDPDDIPAIAMTVQYCQKRRIPLVIVTSAERYDLETDENKDNVGTRARVVQEILKRMNVTGGVTVLSGAPGKAFDEGAAKTRQYNTFLQLHDEKAHYHQPVSGQLRKSMTGSEGEDLTLHPYSSTITTLVDKIKKHTSTYWIGIGAMTNLMNVVKSLVGDKDVQSKMQVYQMGGNVPIVKKFTSTNTHLDADATVYVNNNFEGPLHFVTAGLTSNYRWWSNLQHWNPKTGPAQKRFHESAMKMLSTHGLLELVLANDAKNEDSGKRCGPGPLKYNTEGPVDGPPNLKGPVDGVEVWGKEDARLLYVVRNKVGKEVEVLLGAGLTALQRAESVTRLATALSLETVVVEEFVDKFPELTPDSAIAPFLYAKPSNEWPFPSAFHDPITVAIAICAYEERDEFTKDEFQERVMIEFTAPSAALTSLGIEASCYETLLADQKGGVRGEDQRLSSIVRNVQDLARLELAPTHMVLIPSAVDIKQSDEVLWATRPHPVVPETEIFKCELTGKQRWITGKQHLKEEQVEAIVALLVDGHCVKVGGDQTPLVKHSCAQR